DRYVPLSEHLKHGVSQEVQSAYPAEKICKDPPLRYFKQKLEAWKTSGFARKFKSGTERFCSPDYAQKMPLLQKRKPGDHCHFRASRSAAGFSFRQPTFACEITFADKGTCILLQRKPPDPACRQTGTPSKGYQTPQKKAVLLKNCFVHLNSKNDNSIEEPILEKSHRSFRSTGFHFLSCRQNESLVITYSFFRISNVVVSRQAHPTPKNSPL